MVNKDDFLTKVILFSPLNPPLPSPPPKKKKKTQKKRKETNTHTDTYTPKKKVSENYFVNVHLDPTNFQNYGYVHIRIRFKVYDMVIIVFKVRKEMFYLTMHSAHFIYSYMVSNIW